MALIKKIAPKGSGWIQRGHKYFTINGKAIPEHRIIVEKAIGRKLKGDEVVHHMDENGLNNANTNLCVCPDNAYHKLLHQRINAVKACGNPNWRKCPYCKQYDNPLNMRGEKCGRYVHSICSAKAKKEARRNKNVHSI